ncbi:MAG: 4-hydroxy-tetrahydrodipicolinate reductase [Magnetococcales bacterium]|nr:4-hydroxy-tetrahydrodipicolinate reductase [Magnetococcales bacterium]
MQEIGISGAGGRMGRMLVQAVQAAQDRCALRAASERPDSEWVGQDVGEVAGVGRLGIRIDGGSERLFAPGRVVIDFTQPQATLAHLATAVAVGAPMVIGTTGFDAEGRGAIERAAGRIPIVFAPNFSIGVNLMFRVAADVARVLEESYDIEIIEAHHRHKVDAPSGTALGLGRAIAQAVGRPLEEMAIYGREGLTGARPPRAIGFATVRGGDIVGDHTVLFAGEGERLEITHRASSRMTFAKGAVRAAIWLSGRPAGLYDMGDVLGF